VLTTIPAADRQTATVLVRIAFDTLDPRLLPDMGVKVSFLQQSVEAATERRPRGLMVPKRAVRREGMSDVVYVARDGRARRRVVHLGVTAGDDAEVLSGLTDGERVVIDGPPTLNDSARIKEDPVHECLGPDS
jgi:HlyD family secretion protein